MLVNSQGSLLLVVKTLCQILKEMEILVEANQDAYYSPEEAHIAANEGHGKIYRVFGVLNIEHILLLYEAHTEIRLVVLL